VATTWSVGVSLTPASLSAFSASLDYFHIHLTGEIGTVPEAVTLSQCLATGDPILCSQIVRAPNGSLSGPALGGGYIRGNSVNTGAALVSGVDGQANYRQALGRFGALSAAFTGSWLVHNATTPYRSAPSYDCAGLFGATCSGGSVNPRWRHNLRLSWETPLKLMLSAQWRFIGSTSFDNNSPQALLQFQEEGFFDPYITRIPNYSYLDLSAAWSLNSHIQLRLGCNNLLDKDPPFIPLEVTGRGGSLNTFTTYDLLGRNLFLTMRATF
jgi:outer membrane receptor protein involved in Fe transport